MKRLFFDVSYTRTQPGNVGITRTVRRLLEEFQQSSSIAESVCIPVAFHSDGFRDVSKEAETPVSSVLATSSATDGLAARLLRWMTGSKVRNIVSACLPLPLLYMAWLVYNWWTFDMLSRQARPVAFANGDTLLLCDASWNYRAWVAVRAARRHGVRVVLMVHDLIPLRHPEFCLSLFTLAFQRWLVEMLRCCDAVICNSAATEADLRGYAVAARLPLPPTGHFRLGCDPVRTPSGSGVRVEVSAFVSDGAPCFAAVGSVEPRKNYAWLLSVFEHLWAQGHNVRLLIVGRPTSDCQVLVRRMKQHAELGKKLLPIFDASDEEVAYVYSGCRALIFPTLAEGFGLPLVEARTRGCQVIASDLPVFRELADVGVSIFARNSEDALRVLVIEHAQSNQSATTAPMLPFTWADSARQCLRVVHQLVEHQPKS